MRSDSDGGSGMDGKAFDDGHKDPADEGARTGEPADGGFEYRVRTNRRIVRLLTAISCLFLLLIAYLTYFELFQSESMVTNPYNRRQLEKENNILRGSILDRNGTVLAKSVPVNGKYQRTYPYGALYSHVIGFNSSSYGKTLLEGQYNDYLLGNRGLGAVFNFNLKGTVKKGDDLYLTIDNRLQTLAEQQLGSRNGAIVVMNPKTGEILAMVSKPDFDPNGQSLSENWQELTESDQHPFYARAIQGLYAPGSTFKIVTAASAVDNGLDGMTVNDQGSVTIDGYKISNYNGEAFGKIDIVKAMAVSSNVFFSQLAVKLGQGELTGMAERFGIGRSIPFDLPVKQSSLPNRSMSKADLAAVGIGQGKLLVTPLQIALITSCIADKGVMMRPRLVSKAAAPNGSTADEWGPEPLYNVLSADTAASVGTMMRQVVTSGTGTKAALKGIHVAGKTGTAQNELSTTQKNKEHAWFTGYAPYEDPQVAVTVILEYGGSTGGQIAAPIAGRLIRAALQYHE